MFENTLISFHEREPRYLGALYPMLENYKELKERSIESVLSNSRYDY